MSKLIKAVTICCAVMLASCELPSTTSTNSASDMQSPKIAEWQFIDAETMQPIEGVFVNFAWRGKPDARGMSTCKHGVLGRSGKDGWFRNVSPDPSWNVTVLPDVFAPGFELLSFRYGEPSASEVTAFVEEQEATEFGKFPGFEARLTELGYHYVRASDAGYTWRAHNWIKVMSATGFHNPSDTSIRRIYLATYRSFPGQASAAFNFVGRKCTDPGATNAVDDVLVKTSDQLRMIFKTRYFCDKAWNSIPEQSVDALAWIASAAFEFIPDNKSAEWITSIIPSFKPNSDAPPPVARNLTPEERRTYCGAIKEYFPKGLVP